MVEFLQSNWIWIALIIVFVGMHSFGGGCCGGGGKERRKKEPGEEVAKAEGTSCH